MSVDSFVGRPTRGSGTQQADRLSCVHTWPVPPQPSVRLSGELHRLLFQSDLALGRLDGSIQTLPNPDLFDFMYVRKEAVLSSQIEGTQSSLQDRSRRRPNSTRPETPKDVDEVVNYAAAMNYGLAACLSCPSPCASSVKSTRGSLTVSVVRLASGELRRTQNWIRPRRLHAERGNFPSASTARYRPTGARRFGKAFSRRKRLAASHQDRACARTVRDHSSVSGWQWSHRAPADHVPVMRKRRAAQSRSSTFRIISSATGKVLRSAAGNTRQRRMGRLAGVFSARCSGG